MKKTYGNVQFLLLAFLGQFLQVTKGQLAVEFVDLWGTLTLKAGNLVQPA